MKPTLSCLFLMLIIFTSRAQTLVVYMDKTLNAVTDSGKATTKVFLKKYAEDTTLWAVSQYTMDNRLIVEGVYKERGMNTPNGPFKYYLLKGDKRYLRNSGNFRNGKKFGAWTDYYEDGMKMKVVTWRNDEMNGPYEIYRDKDTIPMISGQYLMGKKNGEWVNGRGTDIYEDDVLMRTIPNKEYERGVAMLNHVTDSLQRSRHIEEPVQPQNFATYMRQKLSSYFNIHDRVDATTSITIDFIVDEHGKPQNGRALEKIEPELQASIAKAIEMAPLWIPAKSNGKPIKGRVHYKFIYQHDLFKRDQ